VNSNISQYAKLVLISSIIAYIFSLCFFPFEDAAILYRYSENLIKFGSIGFNENSVSEGATDFGWMLLISLGSALGLPEFATASFFTIFSLCIFFTKYSNSIQSMFLLMLSLFILPQMYAGLGGFSVIFCSVIYFIFVQNVFKYRNFFNSFVIAFILVFLRPDFILFVAPSILYLIFIAVHPKNVKEVFIICILILSGFFYLYQRYHYFGHLMPLPFYVKSEGSRDLFWFYSSSVNALLVPYLLILVILYLRAKDRLLKFLVLTSVGITLLCCFRLDQNIGNRFFGPVVFGAFGLLIYEKNFREYISVFLIACVALIGSAKLGPRAFFDFVDSRYDEDHRLGRLLSTSEPVNLLVTEAGRVPYYSGLPSIDVWGLNSPEFSRYPFNYQILLDKSWDVAVIHCPIEWFKSDFNVAGLTLNNHRNWGQLCKRLAKAVNELENAKSYVYQYRREGAFRRRLKQVLGNARDNCYRHDIVVLRDSQASHLIHFPLKNIDDVEVAKHDWDNVCFDVGAKH